MLHNILSIHQTQIFISWLNSFSLQCHESHFFYIILFLLLGIILYLHRFAKTHPLLQPESLAPASFTAGSLQRLEIWDTESVRWGPPTQMTSITASTRHHLATAIMVAFNARLATLPKIALVHLCKAVSK